MYRFLQQSQSHRLFNHKIVKNVESIRSVHTADSNKTRQSFQYCMNLVRKYDSEHYFPAIFLPPEIRASTFAIRSFNIETASVSEKTRDFRTSLMRLFWWRDAIDSLFKGKVLEHPVLHALNLVLKEKKLSKHWFDRILQARIEDIERSTAPPNISFIEKYAENTASSIHYLILQSSNISSVHADHAISHIGKAQVLSLLLRSTHHHISKRKLYLPVDVLAKHDIVEEDLFNGKGVSSLSDVSFEMASTANSHLNTARSLQNSIPDNAKKLMLPGVIVGEFLKKLEKVDFDIFDSRLQRGVCGINPLLLQMKLFYHAWRGTY